MKYDSLTRRHFLQGMSGSLMALPLLPSLIPRQALADTIKAQKFFVLITVDHGGTGFNKDWFPAPFIDNINSNLFSKTILIPEGGQNGVAHTIRHAELNKLLSTDPGHDGGNVDNNQQRLSFILGSFLNPYLNKINMYVGIDGGMHYYGHSRSISGGSIAGVNGPVTWPTVDHFLANSSKFYLNKDATSIPVLHYSPFYSWTSDGVNYPVTDHKVSKIYSALFNKYQGTQDTNAVAIRQRRSFLIDRVLEDFNRIIRGNTSLSRKISSVDKQRLSQHAEFMYATDRKYQNLINSCSDYTQPHFPKYDALFPLYYGDDRFNPGSIDPQGDYNKTWDLLTDLIAAAFSCGATNIANLSGSNHFFLHQGDYHAEIVHQHENSRAAQLVHNQNIRWQTEHLFGAVVKKLDGIDMGNGQTLLDRGLVTMIHEAGFITHNHYTMGCVTAGSANGFYKTGKLIDYRNLQNLGLMLDHTDPNNTNRRPGIPIQRFYGNILQSMGHIPADYRRNNLPGYGGNQSAPSFSGTRNNPGRHIPYPDVIVNSFDDLLPIVT